MESQVICPKAFQREIEIPIRVHYYETDQMGVVHHSNYFRYFEEARMEQFRMWGHPYSQVEANGIFFMIIDTQCKCRVPAHFDELIFVKAWVHKMTRYRIVHHYEVRRAAGETIATGKTVLVSVTKEGLPVPLPESLWNLWLTSKGIE
jgi:acyl-CoA thioester hydrolase